MKSFNTIDPTYTAAANSTSFVVRLLGLAMMMVTFQGFAASPWFDTGDAALRADIEMLADLGVITTPVTTWPLPVADIANAVLDDDAARNLQISELQVLQRVRDAVMGKIEPAVVMYQARVAIAGERNVLRGFQDSPRAGIELEGQAEGLLLGSQLAYRARVAQLENPDDNINPRDDKKTRLDGSYLVASLGNMMIGVGAQDRWWGPGWDGSLILGNNARPVPSVFFQRNRSTAFNSRWLSWLGPWQVVGFLGKLESDRVISDARLFALRLSFKPTRNLEIGLSRTAQWAGEGRPNDLESFGKLLIGQDNTDESQADIDNQPGNQLAGYDVRYSLRGFGLPVSLYTQLIGEDEAGLLPSKYLGLFGVSGRMAVAGILRGTILWRVEYADTSAGLFRSNSDSVANTAYEHFIYQSGYRYYNRSLGHTLDNDSKMLTAGAVYSSPGALSQELVLRMGEFNFDGTTGNASVGRRNSEADFYGADWTAVLQLSQRSQVQAGLSYLNIDEPGRGQSYVLPYVQWVQDF